MTTYGYTAINRLNQRAHLVKPGTRVRAFCGKLLASAFDMDLSEASWEKVCPRCKSAKRRLESQSAGRETSK